jgi:hypothetical protein
MKFLPSRSALIGALTWSKSTIGVPNGQIRALPLAESQLDAAALWQHAAEDCGAAIASAIGDPQGGADFGDEGGWREGEMSAESVGKTAFSGIA